MWLVPGVSTNQSRAGTNVFKCSLLCVVYPPIYIYFICFVPEDVCFMCDIPFPTAFQAFWSSSIFSVHHIHVDTLYMHLDA